MQTIMALIVIANTQEDKKYECRTGPFEGFFVSSVEFCKFNKFEKNNRNDSSRDNRIGIQGSPGPQGQTGPSGPQGIQGERRLTGTTGPQGIQGPIGPNGTQGERGLTGLTGPASMVPGSQGNQGPQGLSGLNVINETNLYYNPGQSVQSTQDFDAKSSAVCDMGDIALGGNYRVSATTDNRFLVSFDGNEGIDTYSTIIIILGTDPGSINFQSSVFCFDNPPPH